MNVSGYAYVEVLIGALVITLAVGPAADALREVAMHAATQRLIVTESYAAMGTMETVLAEPFHTLESEAAATKGLAESSYSEPPGTENRHIVMVSPYDLDDADKDGNPLTGTDPGVVWVGVSVENLGIAFQSITADDT